MSAYLCRYAGPSVCLFSVAGCCYRRERPTAGRTAPPDHHTRALGERGTRHQTIIHGRWGREVHVTRPSYTDTGGERHMSPDHHKRTLGERGTRHQTIIHGRWGREAHATRPSYTDAGGERHTSPDHHTRTLVERGTRHQTIINGR